MKNYSSIRGYRNNNPGNLEKGDPWQGLAQDQSSDPRFCVFKDAKWGIRAIARTLITYQDDRRAKDGSKIDSANEIVERWAPDHENPTDAYAQFIAKQIHRAADDETIDVYDYDTMRGLVEAIIHFELGGQPYDEKTINAGLRLAGIEVPARDLRKSRTMNAGTVAGGSTIAALAVDKLQAAQDFIAPLGLSAEHAQIGLVVLALVGIGVTLWARIDDANSEARA